MQIFNPIKWGVLILFTSFLTSSVTVAQPVYRYQKGDPQGSGKWYYNREIAPVMSHYGIGWLERSEREEEEKVSLLIQNMDIQTGEIVADIGAGSGYHVERMAPLAGSSGRIKAVDIQQEMLDYAEAKLIGKGIKNVDYILGTEKSARLKAETIDKILMVDVYHEFEFPREMAESLYQALRKGGRVFLIEYRAEDDTVPIKKLHKMTEEQAIKELESIGFRFVQNLTNLPWQHCLIFEK